MRGWTHFTPDKNLRRMKKGNATDRRKFLSDSFSVASAFTIGGAFASLSSRIATGETPAHSGKALVPAKDETTGLPLLKLPEGFRYKTFGWTKDLMRGNVPTPSAHDGMAVVKEDNGVVTMVRNHEIGSYGKSLKIDGKPFDAKAGGGCSSLTFDTKNGEWLDSWISLSGSVRNCAGGATPWETWLTCEETVIESGDIQRKAKVDLNEKHGWVFDVPPEGQKNPVPIKAMGRFVHEAVAVDRETGIVYQTEDRGSAGFYRYIPNDNKNLAAGGKLQMMKVIGQPDLRGHVKNGSEFDVQWVNIADPELAHSPGTTDSGGVFKQGQKLGGTVFARLEGCWFGNERVFFDATSGGGEKVGQIWAFNPKSQKLQMLFESPGVEVLNMPDNLVVSPHGGLLLCEDSDYGKFSQQRIHGLDQDGNLSLFAINNMQLKGEKNGFKGDFRGKEWAGATFSPNGKWLFVNIQTPGVTFAITGPWNETVF